MKLSEMTTSDELLAEQLRTDPEFRERLGMKQPQVARLELGR